MVVWSSVVGQWWWPLATADVSHCRQAESYLSELRYAAYAVIVHCGTTATIDGAVGP